MRRGLLGISQSASAVVALAATAIIVAIVFSAQMPTLFAVQKAGAEQAGEAEKLAGVRLSLVAILDDGTAIIANDGATPVTLDRLYTPAGITALSTPITIQPGQKVSLIAGNAEAIAVGLLGGEKVVLKEKPGLQLATATSYTSCCVTTRYVLTRSTTLTYTQYSPYIVTATVATMAGSTTSTTTITNTLKNCIICTYTTTTSYLEQYYYYTPYVATLATRTVTSTAFLQVLTSTETTTSVDTHAVPWTLWYVTHVTYISPSPTTTTTTSSVTATLPTYTVTTTTTTVSSAIRHTLSYTSVVVRPTATTTTTVTVTHTTAVVS